MFTHSMPPSSMPGWTCYRLPRCTTCPLNHLVYGFPAPACSYDLASFTQLGDLVGMLVDRSVWFGNGQSSFPYRSLEQHFLDEEHSSSLSPILV